MSDAARTGRRPGKPDTRAHILTVAGEVFRRQGFDGASVRGIAREAGVDQALVHRYFGTKRELFLASIRIGFDVDSVAAHVALGGPAGVGVRLMTTITALWESPVGRAMIETIRSSPELTRSLAAYLHEPIMAAAIAMLGMSRREADVRAALVEAQMMGLAQARFLTPREPVAALTRDELIRVYAPIMQRLLTEDLGLSITRRKSSPHG